jgi:D-2-hydroxyacid dehydrogenase (NADP+)
MVSKRVADAYRPRIADIFSRAGAALDLQVFSLESPRPRHPDIAFYSRDVWEGCDKARVNPETEAFFEIVDAAPSLAWLHVTSAGADLPMYQPSIARGVRVTTSSGANAEPISQTVLWAVLSFARPTLHWAAARSRREWSPLTGAALPRDLAGDTAVVVGTGPIGRAIARLLKVVGMRTIGVRRGAGGVEPFDETTTYESIDLVLPSAHWLVLACPLSETTHGLIGEQRLALLPRDAKLINVARGEVVDEPALVAALQGGKLAGAYLDVFAAEPLQAESPLWDMPNVILTPHNCSASAGNAPRGVEIFLRNLEAYLAGRPLENDV